MADVAAITGDSSYIKAIKIWDNIVSKKIYIGIGAHHAGEAFGNIRARLTCPLIVKPGLSAMYTNTPDVLNAHPTRCLSNGKIQANFRRRLFLPCPGYRKTGRNLI